MNNSRDITIIIPAFNEEKNITGAIHSVVGAISDIVDDYEIIVVDDGSRDRTGLVAEEEAGKNSKVRVVYNGTNKGFGAAYQRGVKLATKTYIGVFPGDNDMAGESLRDLVKHIGRADVITSFPADTRNRSIFRRIVSRAFVLLMNGLFGLRLKYFNGSSICKSDRLKAIPIKSTGLTALAECLVRLVKMGCTYQEIPFAHTGRKSDVSKAFTLKSIRAVLGAVFALWKDITFPPSTKNNPSCETSS